ncbi:MAG: DUF3147 family protein [Sphingomonas sp.]
MTQFWVRALLSGVIVAAIATIARRNPAAGALVASLPLLSILGMLWLWHDTRDGEKMARHVEATFWYVLPSLPMFLLIPGLLRHGVGFWLALLAGCALTLVAYLATIGIAARFGVRL